MTNNRFFYFDLGFIALLLAITSFIWFRKPKFAVGDCIRVNPSVEFSEDNPYNKILKADRLVYYVMPYDGVRLVTDGSLVEHSTRFIDREYVKVDCPKKLRML
jgi:hypothetical protein